MPDDASPPVSTRPFERGADDDWDQLELVVVSRGRATRHPIHAGRRLIVGREPDCDLPVADENVSRHHLALHATEGGIQIEDLGSSNGTFVRGTKLQPGTIATLGPHEPVELASTVLVLQPVDVRGRQATFERLAPVLAEPADFTAVQRLAASDGPVAVVGPPGAGKSEVARALHRLSGRGGPFEVVDIASVPPTETLELLFGRERAGRAGAVVGRIEAANGGTLVLSRIEELPASGQRQLLECIERKSLRRDGALSVRRVDVSVVFTSRDPVEALVRMGGLEPALAHRLRGRIVRLVPLADRTKDLPSIVHALLHELAREQSTAVVSTDAFVQAVAMRAWPGNLRELVEALESSIAAADGRPLAPSHLPEPAAADAEDTASGAERRQILEALRRCNGNQTAAARLLGIARRTLINRIERYGIPRPRKLD